MAQPVPGADPATPPTPQDVAALALLVVFFLTAVAAGLMVSPFAAMCALSGASLVCSLVLGLSS